MTTFFDSLKPMAQCEARDVVKEINRILASEYSLSAVSAADAWDAYTTGNEDGTTRTPAEAAAALSRRQSNGQK